MGTNDTNTIDREAGEHSFSFRHAHAVVCALIQNVDGRTLKNRMNQWRQHQGCPRGSKTGRGRAAVYTRAMVLECAFVAELSRFGIIPDRSVPMAVRLVDNGGSIIRPDRDSATQIVVDRDRVEAAVDHVLGQSK